MKNILIVLMSLFCFKAIAQIEPVEVTHQLIKIEPFSKEEMFFSFAEGDMVKLKVNVDKGKTITEVDIYREPNKKIYSTFKSSKFTKTINIREKGVYRFLFKNSAVGKRIVGIDIERTPISNDLVSFSTDWKWIGRYDTTYVPYKKDSLVGYDTTDYQETVKELVKTEKKDEMVSNKSVRVNSVLNSNGPRAETQITIPNDLITPLREEKIIGWAYWISVGKEGQEAYEKNVKSTMNTLASTFVSPLAGVIMGQVSNMIMPSSGEDVQFYIVDNNNLYKYRSGLGFTPKDRGKGIASYGKFTPSYLGTFLPNERNYTIALYNDNQVTPIDVDIKVDILKEIKYFKNVTYNKKRVTPRYVTLNKVRRDIKRNMYRVTVE
jgi:hypothetical protein